MSRQNKTRAFTLVELLVVIGIIALLVGILLPTLGRARRQAQSIACCATLQQLANSIHLHAADRKGFIPLAGTLKPVGAVGTTYTRFPVALGDPQRVRYSWTLNGSLYLPLVWQAALAPYLNRTYKVPTQDAQLVESMLNQKSDLWKHLMCPSGDSQNIRVQQGNPSGSVPTIADDQARGIAYWFNGADTALWWSSNGNYAVNEGLMGYDSDARVRRLRGNINKVRSASQILLFSDAQRRSNVNHDWMIWTPINPAGGSSIQLPIRSINLGEAFNTDPAVLSKSQFALNRHAGRINVAFLDGHVESRMINKASLTDVLLLPPP